MEEHPITEYGLLKPSLCLQQRKLLKESSATALHIPGPAVPARLHPVCTPAAPGGFAFRISCVSLDGNLHTSQGTVVCLRDDGHREREMQFVLIYEAHTRVSWRPSWGSLYKLTPYFNILQSQQRPGVDGAAGPDWVSWYWRSPLTGPCSA